MPINSPSADIIVMARLQRLVLQGFKSFKRKTSVPFSPGFSAITGPNGTGKSNISESLIFVLGKSSSKAMRAKRGEELIFHGSKNKLSSDFASVAVYFDNSQKKIPVDSNEVSVSRKVNKSGVSTYRLNGRVVTRQQVVDLLAQAGIFPDGHNIIQQGDVNHIVEMDPVQRREMLDEISGIREYDEKREKALKELGKVQEKVREAEIILTEKGTVMEKLRSERNLALENKNLHEELEKIALALLLNDFNSTKASLEQISKEASEKEKEFEGVEKTLQNLEIELEKEEKSFQALTKEVVQASSQIEVSRKIAVLQSSIEGKKEKMAALNRELERLDSLIERVSRIENRVVPGVKEIMGMQGVKGVLLDLIAIPRDYRTAIEVAASGHLSDVVVDYMDNAVKCINFLKERRLGRARFLPLDKIQPGRKDSLPPASLGWLSDLIQFDRKYSAAIEFVFGRTACVKDIETAKEIMRRNRVRMVTLDGDLVEVSGAMTGGFYRKRSEGGDVKSYLGEKASLHKEISSLDDQIKILSKELAILAEKEKKTRTFDIEKERHGIDKRLEKIREGKRFAYEKRLGLQQELGRLNIQKAKIEARFDSLKLQVPVEKTAKSGSSEKTTKYKKETPETDSKQPSVSSLREREKEIISRLQAIGPVNMKAIDEFDSIGKDFEEFRVKVDKIAEERAAIEESIQQIEGRRMETFTRTMSSVAKNFRDIYKDLTGGEAELILEKDLDGGLLIKATPPGKKLLHIDTMSGGEKTLTAFAFLFALQKHKPAPFYILDEADATLDKINTERVARLIRKQSKDAQFIIISHNDSLVREADQIYGVTMDDGESKIMGIELPKKTAN